jgi:DNA-binding CsgD family transcriptional regulator
MENEITPKSTSVKFTARQLHVIKCWSEVGGEKEIAEILGISVNSVHTHLRRMRKKLGVKRTFNVYKYVKDNDLI